MEKKTSTFDLAGPLKNPAETGKASGQATFMARETYVSVARSDYFSGWPRRRSRYIAR
jgi:hypothetical protein